MKYPLHLKDGDGSPEVAMRRLDHHMEMQGLRRDNGGFRLPRTTRKMTDRKMHRITPRAEMLAKLAGM